MFNEQQKHMFTVSGDQVKERIFVQLEVKNCGIGKRPKCNNKVCLMLLGSKHFGSSLEINFFS